MTFPVAEERPFLAADGWSKGPVMGYSSLATRPVPSVPDERVW